jgi:hypothetical protein
MAIYATFFVCAPSELGGGFPGWRLRLTEPVHRKRRRPGTGEVEVVETYEPDWPDDEPGLTIPTYQVVAITGDYADYLESRLSPFVQNCPHWAAKGLTQLEMQPLLEAAGISAPMMQPIYAPPSFAAGVWHLPELVGKLLSPDLQEVARKWAEVMSTPSYTHSVTGERLEDDWTTSEALDILLPLVDLVRKASAGRQMYLLNEW